jgi:hypothetical protein
MDITALTDTATVTDTLRLVQSQTNSWLDWASVGISLLIAFFTGGYFCYTIKIFRQTREQADAAKVTSKAAKEGNEISAKTQFFPAVDVSVFSPSKDGSSHQIRISNFSDNLAMGVTCYAKFEISNNSFPDLENKRFISKMIIFENVQDRSSEYVDIPDYLLTAHILLAFEDILANRYFRFRSFTGFQEKGS